MTDILRGVRILEVAQWWFVPAAGALLADWGADVIKVEHPVTGDGQRGLIASGLVSATGGVNFMMEQSNRGKRSVGIDIGHAIQPRGKAQLSIHSAIRIQRQPLRHVTDQSLVGR